MCSSDLNRHYLDHASSSPPRPEVISAMTDWLEQAGAGDPSRIHEDGRQARAAIEEAREKVAALLGTRARQVIFTSSGTEAANAAIWGASRAHPGASIACAAVEHSCVIRPAARMAPVVELSVDKSGRIQAEDVEELLAGHRGGKRPVALVNCQWANHEIGTVQPVETIVSRCRDAGVLTHIDASAAAGHVPLDLEGIGADLVSVSAHKLGGPLGAGALVVRRGLRLEPLLMGGTQERARRAGIENLPAIVGFGAAAETLTGGSLQREATTARQFTETVLTMALALPGTSALGDPRARVPHIVCLGIEDVLGEAALIALDHLGISVHSGSACSSESFEPSPVIQAIGADPNRSLRVSVGWSSTAEDIDAFSSAFPQVLAELRALRT